MFIRSTLFSSLALFAVGSTAQAQDFEIPFEFRAGDPARADEVNQNFAALAEVVKELRAELDELRPQVEELSAANSALQVELDALEEQFGPLDLEVDALQAQDLVLGEQLVAVEDKTEFIRISTDTLDGVRGPHMILEDVNLHLRSGSGSTEDGQEPLGLGNLIVGYNEPGSTTEERTGSHNLVIGRAHKFSSTGGLVAGLSNTISGEAASVLGGTNNTASGLVAVVSGGGFNRASGEQSAVSGGVSNFATALRASISGGAQNTASGIASSITGGSGGAAGGFAASIAGGQSGIASGDQSSICGGQSNSAFGDKSVVSAGFNQQVLDDFDWRACNVTCD